MTKLVVNLCSNGDMSYSPENKSYAHLIDTYSRDN